MHTIMEFVGSEADLEFIDCLLPQEFRSEAAEMSAWLRKFRKELRGILLIVEQEEQQKCIGVALGIPDGQRNLHLTEGIQICNREQLPMVELVRHLIEYARGKFISICDSCYPYAPGYKELFDAYGQLGFNIDRDPVFLAAALVRSQGIERTPEELSPQPIRNTYFDLDVGDIHS